MTDQSTMLDALAVAMIAEQKAAKFYREAAEKTSSPRGQNLLQQLAAFETAHYEVLDGLRKSMSGGGGTISYEGSNFEAVPAAVTAKGASHETNLNEVSEILKLAIGAEDAAHERYVRMAESTDDPAARELFQKLAAEETQHRRILSDEFFQLNNSGDWVWME